MSAQNETSVAKIDWQSRLTSKRSSKFAKLYPAQEAALSSYSETFLKTPTVAVELPTGSGKSLIALMILDFWMEQRKRTAVLCGTKNLARQFKAEAESLGIPTILFEGPKAQWKTADKFRYTQAKAIAVLNYWGYINQSPGIDPADVLILDDAHLAENAAHGLFSIEINRFDNSVLFQELIDSLASRFPHYTPLSDYQQNNLTPFGPIELINFTDWLDFIPYLESVMGKAPACQHGGNLHFPWNRLRGSLRSALCFVGPNTITIRPGSYPLSTENHIRKPQQRILLSATIGSADDLSRRIGVPNIKHLPIPARFRLAVPGKRLLAFPDTDSREADMEKLAFECALKLRRSVWLCASSHEADLWSAKLRDQLNSRQITDQPIFLAKGQAEEIDQFVDSDGGHLFTAARYDGMDFEGDTCRLVVMPSVPQACGALERFFSENLADAAFMHSRTLQRIKQALGRATRSDHDWSVYVFLKSSFTQYLTSADFFEQFPSNVQDEIGFGVGVSTLSFDEIMQTVDAFFRGKLVEIGFPQKAQFFPDEIKPETKNIADDEIDFWNKLFVTHGFDQAALSAGRVATALEADEQPGYALFWRYLKTLASYLRYSVDGEPSGLVNARNEVSRLLEEPRQSAWFSRLNRLRQTLLLEPITDESDFDEFDALAGSWNQLLNGDLRNFKKHEDYFTALRAGLVGTDHKIFCHSLKSLLRILGWESEIREKDEGETDVIAKLLIGRKRFLLIFEGKPEMGSGKPVPLRYVNQASGQLVRYKSNPSYEGFEIAAVLVSNADQLDDTAALAASQLTFLRQTAIGGVAEIGIAAFLRYAAIRNRRGLLPKRSECLEALQMSPRVVGLFDACKKKGSILPDDELIAFVKR